MQSFTVVSNGWLLVRLQRLLLEEATAALSCTDTERTEYYASETERKPLIFHGSLFLLKMKSVARMMSVPKCAVK